MIKLQNIKKTYESGGLSTPVLKDVSFSINKCEYVAIMGTSGTGKSTLMNILGCLDQQTEGSYSLDNEEVKNLDDDARAHLRNKKIGFIFQQFNLLERTSALKNVMLPLIYSTKYPAQAEEKAKSLLNSVGLSDRLHYKTNQLSGGQQQRVAIARALVTDPEIILADEPTGNLDETSGAEIMEIFTKLHQNENRTIILITHDKLVAENAQRIILLKAGNIAKDFRNDQQNSIKQINNSAKKGESK